MSWKINNAEFPQEHFAWRWLDHAQAGLAHSVHLSAVADAPPGLVRSDTLAHFAAHAGEPEGKLGATVGCFLSDGGLAAYGVLGLASESADHLAEILGVTAAERPRFCILDGAAVLPDWRGYGLHLDTIAQRFKRARALGRTRIGATVAPRNMCSLRGLLNAGMLVRDFQMCYGDQPRLAMEIDLTQPAPAWTLRCAVVHCDEAGHRQALADGLTGYCSANDPSSGLWHVHYGTPLSTSA